MYPVESAIFKIKMHKNNMLTIVSESDDQKTYNTVLMVNYKL